MVLAISKHWGFAAESIMRSSPLNSQGWQAEVKSTAAFVRSYSSAYHFLLPAAAFSWAVLGFGWKTLMAMLYKSRTQPCFFCRRNLSLVCGNKYFRLPFESARDVQSIRSANGAGFQDLRACGHHLGDEVDNRGVSDVPRQGLLGVCILSMRQQTLTDSPDQGGNDLRDAEHAESYLRGVLAQ